MIRRLVGDGIAAGSVWLTLEATAALWHLVLFRRAYADDTAALDRGLAQYRVGALLGFNALRAAAYVVIHRRRRVRDPRSRGLDVGIELAVPAALAVGTYYGVWRFGSARWLALELPWLVAQGALVGATLDVVTPAEGR